MTKRPPDKVIEYRISLQDKERELLEGIQAAYIVRGVGAGFGAALRPIVAGLSDASFVILMIILYEYYTDKDTGLLQFLDDSAGEGWGWMINGWNAYRMSPAYAEQYEERARTPGGGLHNILDAIISALSGADIQRWQESENYPGT